MPSASPEQPKTRPWVVVVGVLAIVAGVGWSIVRVVDQPSSLPMKDFLEYWSAAKVNLAGGNPYDAAQLKPHQDAVLGGPSQEGVTMMWNPPWVLALVTPLGLLSATAGHYLFLAIQLVVILASVTLLWKVYRGPPSALWVAWIVALYFGPSLFVMWFGQMGGLLLFGLVGFLYFRDRRPALAGLCLALTAIKPHLLFAVGLAVVLDAGVTRRTRVAVAVGFVAVVTAAAAAWAMNPAVYGHYAGAGWQQSTAINISPKDWKQPLVSYWLRIAIDEDRFWIQFVPTVVTALAVAVYWWRKRHAWDWPTELPRLVFVSALSAAYGAWCFDLVVLLVPIVPVAAALAAHADRRRYAVAAGYFLLTVCILCTGEANKALTGEGLTGQHLFIWVTPTVLALCLWGRRIAAAVPRERPADLTATPLPGGKAEAAVR